MNYIHYSLSDSYPFKIVLVDIMGIYVLNCFSVNNPSVDYTSVKKEQGGTHECQATNAVGTTKESMVLNVLCKS